MHEERLLQLKVHARKAGALIILQARGLQCGERVAQRGHLRFEPVRHSAAHHFANESDDTRADNTSFRILKPQIESKRLSAANAKVCARAGSGAWKRVFGGRQKHSAFGVCEKM